MPSGSVVSLPVNPSTRHALLAAGLSSAQDLRGLSADGLAQAAGLTQAQAASVLEQSLGMPRPGWRLSGAMSAAELLSSAHSLASHSSGPAALGDRQQSVPRSTQRRIPTGCRRLDELLGGGGLACGTVTEFFGVPGVGKTQFGMQLAVNAQLPQHLGGLGGKVLYVDTEGSFMTDRLIDMAAAAVQRVQQEGAAAAATAHQQQQQQQQSDQQQAAGAASVSVEGILANILYFRVQHHAEQLALTRVLGTLLTSQPEVVLVVIDSVTFHFRQDFRDAAQRARLMAGMAGQLAAAAEQHDVAVVMMNQVVTRIAEQPGRGGIQAAGSSAASSSRSNAAAWLAPALGEGWGQAAACRVALFWQGSQRLALLVKAKEVPQQQRQQQQQAQPQVLCAAYQVGPSGVTD